MDSLLPKAEQHYNTEQTFATTVPDVPWEFGEESFIKRAIGEVSPPLAAQCAFSVAKKLAVCLDSYSTLPAAVR